MGGSGVSPERLRPPTAARRGGGVTASWRCAVSSTRPSPNDRWPSLHECWFRITTCQYTASCTENTRVGRPCLPTRVCRMMRHSRSTHKVVGGMSIAHPTHCAPSGTRALRGRVVISGYGALRPRETDQPHRYRSSPAAERATELPRASEQGSKAWPTGSGSGPERWSGSASKPDYRSA